MDTPRAKGYPAPARRATTPARDTMSRSLALPPLSQTEEVAYATQYASGKACFGQRPSRASCANELSYSSVRRLVLDTQS